LSSLTALPDGLPSVFCAASYKRKNLEWSEVHIPDSGEVNDRGSADPNPSWRPSAADLESYGARRVFPGFIIAEAPSGKFRLRISTEAMQNLGRSVAASDEATGVLNGRVREASVLETTIDDFTPCIAPYNQLPSKTLLVGYFRAQLDSSAALNAEDHRLLESEFALSTIAVICVPAGAERLCHVYLREAGQWREQLSFPLRLIRARLPRERSSMAGLPEEGSVPELNSAETAQPVRLSAPKSARGSAAQWLIAVGLLLGIASVALLEVRAPHSGVVPGARTPGLPRVQVSRELSGLRVAWDGDDPDIYGATKVVLSIRDGALKTDIPLDSDQLRLGHILYQPVNRDVTFSLQVHHGEKTSFTETVRGSNQ
jgi:hypothetical protein